MAHAVQPVPYPAISKLAIVGDRRTAAMVSADGTVCWLCMPDYNGKTLFASLLDAEQGGLTTKTLRNLDRVSNVEWPPSIDTSCR